MTTNTTTASADRRIAALERQVADLAARVEQVAHQACVVRTLEEIRLERQADPWPAVPPRRPRHLRSVNGEA